MKSKNKSTIGKIAVISIAAICINLLLNSQSQAAPLRVIVNFTPRIQQHGYIQGQKKLASPFIRDRMYRLVKKTPLKTYKNYQKKLVKSPRDEKHFSKDIPPSSSVKFTKPFFAGILPLKGYPITMFLFTLLALTLIIHDCLKIGDGSLAHNHLPPKEL